MHPAAKRCIQHTFHTIQQSLANDIVATTAKERRRFWKAWKQWMAVLFPDIKAERFHQLCPVQIELLAAFGAHVHCRSVLKQKQQVNTKTV